MQNKNGTITPAMQHGVTVMVACLMITMQTSVRPTLLNVRPTPCVNHKAV